ncbi:uncharacterized protein LOC142225295 [Haematobia irritans]|uniref:uncharacterized protein LOC142225295 n=1 Tax=Haematobia irritans TaxID=7368 RepID=UPI003F4FDA1E
MWALIVYVCGSYSTTFSDRTPTPIPVLICSNVETSHSPVVSKYRTKKPCIQLTGPMNELSSASVCIQKCQNVVITTVTTFQESQGRYSLSNKRKYQNNIQEDTLKKK